MIKHLSILFSVVILFGITSSNECFAMKYYCSDFEYNNGFFGTYDTEAKAPDAKQCEEWKQYSFTYDSCMEDLNQDLHFYQRTLKAYKNGKCFPIQTRTYKYGTASCKAEFYARGKEKGLDTWATSGNSSDRQKCIEILNNNIRKEYPELQGMGF